MSYATYAFLMGRPGWRWAVLAALVAALVSLPTLAGALPAGPSDLTADALLQRIRDSDRVAWSGYGESRGSLVLPGVDELGELPSLVGDTTRARAWWRAPDDWRVDEQRLAGERDTTRDGGGGWTWDSAGRQAVRVDGELALRLPRAVDLLAPTLGHRLAGTAQMTASRLPARRVAGRSAAGVQLVPERPAATTVQAFRLWADPQNGLPLRVEVQAAGRPVLVSLLLDLNVSVPPPERTRFRPPPDASVSADRAPDLAAAIDRFAPFALPDELIGLPRRSRGVVGTGGGAATYGDGPAAVAVLPLPRELAGRIVRRIEPGDDDRMAAVSTPLVNAVVTVDRRRRGYLVVGTVPPATLERALVELASRPPSRRDR